MDYQNILSEASIIVKNAGAFIREHFGKVSVDEVIIKEPNSLVSYVDQQAENILVSGLTPILADAGFITEEETIAQNQNQDVVWIIDPLDGTTNFLHNLRYFAVSVALQVNGKMVIGMVYDVMDDDLYHAILGNGAFKNDSPIGVSLKPFTDSLIATGFPYAHYYNIDANLAIFKYMLTNARGIRRYGAAALDLCYVACGKLQGYYEGRLNPWDVAAGALIVQEAGGIVTDYNGGDSYGSGHQIIAASESIHKVMLENISLHLEA